ncbi:MAG: hypothetical protein GY821_15125 [Gammaproteobacteria bacterium]|nr:hypothetical protein [Gammaproteobacteria bacterium]
MTNNLEQNPGTRKNSECQTTLLARYPASIIFSIGLVIFLLLRLLSLSTIKAAASAKGVVYTSLFLYFTRNMFTTGPTLFPYIHGNYYPDYLATTTFFSYLTSLPFGHANLFTISIPYCIAGAAMLAFIYHIGALYNRRWGLYGVLCALLTWKFTQGINALALDIFPALATVITFYLVDSAELHKRYRRLWWLPITLLFGFLTRGPIGLIVPAAVAGGYYLFTWRWQKFIILAVVAAVLLAASTALMLWLAYHVGGQRFLQAVMMQEGLARVYRNHSFRFYFYFSNGLCNYFISALFAVIVIVMKWRQLFLQQPPQAEQRLLRQLAIWLLLIIFAFTLINSKKARYVFAIIPAISLLAGYLFIYEQERFKTIQRLFISLLRWLPVVGLVCAISLPLYNHWAPRHPVYAAFGASAVFCAIMIVINLLLQRYLNKKALIPVIIAGIISLLGISVLLIEPATFHPTGEQMFAVSHPG